MFLWSSNVLFVKLVYCQLLPANMFFKIYAKTKAFNNFMSKELKKNQMILVDYFSIIFLLILGLDSFLLFVPRKICFKIHGTVFHAMANKVCLKHAFILAHCLQYEFVFVMFRIVLHHKLRFGAIEGQIKSPLRLNHSGKGEEKHQLSGGTRSQLLDGNIISPGLWGSVMRSAHCWI